MQDWQLPYLGRRAFPAELTDFELRQFFTFDEIERADIRRAFRSRLRLGAALQLGFLRLTGASLHSMEYVPAAVLKLLGLQLGVPAPDLATLRALYRREMTRMAHQSWAIEYAGFRALDSDGEALLIAFLHRPYHQFDHQAAARARRPRLVAPQLVSHTAGAVVDSERPRRHTHGDERRPRGAGEGRGCDFVGCLPGKTARAARWAHDDPPGMAAPTAWQAFLEDNAAAVGEVRLAQRTGGTLQEPADFQRAPAGLRPAVSASPLQ